MSLSETIHYFQIIDSIENNQPIKVNNTNIRFRKINDFIIGYGDANIVFVNHPYIENAKDQYIDCEFVNVGYFKDDNVDYIDESGLQNIAIDEFKQLLEKRSWCDLYKVYTKKITTSLNNIELQRIL